MKQIKSIGVSPFLTYLKTLPGQTVLCKPISNIPFIYVTFLYVAMCNCLVWTSCCLQTPVSFDFKQKSQWSSLVIVVPGCWEAVLGGEMYTVFSIDFQGKATLHCLLLIFSFQLALSIIMAGDMSFRIEKKMRKPPFSDLFLLPQSLHGNYIAQLRIYFFENKWIWVDMPGSDLEIVILDQNLAHLFNGFTIIANNKK